MSRVRPLARHPRRVNASGEDGVSLSEAEHDELKALEESGDAFAKLVELAKEGGVDIPAPVTSAASMC